MISRRKGIDTTRLVWYYSTICFEENKRHF